MVGGGGAPDVDTELDGKGGGAKGPGGMEAGL